MSVTASLDLPLLVQFIWFVAVFLFVAALRMMSSPLRARRGIWLSGVAFILVLGSYFIYPESGRNLLLLGIALLLGGGIGLWQSLRLEISKTPRMVAMLNSLGGLAAACVAVLALLQARRFGIDSRSLAVVGCYIGCVAFAGSFYAWLRLGGHLSRQSRFVNYQVPYLASAVLVVVLGLLLSASSTASPILLALFIVLALAFGVLMAMPIAAADLPVLISIFNALTGLAVAFDGYVLENPVMIVAGMLVFSAAAVLTRLMARSLNRRLSEIMYSGFSLVAHRDYRERVEDQAQVNAIDARDAAIDLAFASRVVVVPGYGMAVSQAHHKVRELSLLLEERGVDTAFAIHPVAGRMPGHINVLLAEAGVPYEHILDIEEINTEFSQVDVVLVVGANDVVNTGARDDPDSPLAGMPILDVDRARRVIVLKRGSGSGYAGIDNPLLSSDVTRVLFGDARASVQSMILHLKEID